MIRFLHTRIRVSDMERSIDFYKLLGFQLTRRMNSPMGNKLAYMSIPGSEHEMEFCWSNDYEVRVPEDLMHVALGVDDIMETCARLKDEGVDVWPPDWRTSLPAVSPDQPRIAFVTDPDGYEVELIENKR